MLALAIAVGLATAVSPYASDQPDGLSRVAADHGFDGRARLAALQADAPAAGYALPGVSDRRLARGLAGFAGTIGVFGLGLGVASALRRRAGAALPGVAAGGRRL